MTELDDRYWTRNCHGFRVDVARRRLGIVEDVLYGAEPDRPAALVVRGGVLGGRVELVPVEAVETIEPSRRRLTLTRLSLSLS
jgi:hypothetical protein